MTEDQDRVKRHPPRWPMWAGVIVLLGSLATLAYTVGETFWG